MWRGQGTSLMDQLEARKQAMRGKQRCVAHIRCRHKYRPVHMADALS